MIAARMLYGIAFGAALVGAAVRLMPPLRPTAATLAPASAPIARERRSAPAREDSNAYDVIAAKDVFSPTRMPPAVRFTPDRGIDQPAPTRVVHRAPIAEPTVHLFGITIAPPPSGAVAMIGGSLYRVGDRVGGGTVAAMTESTVVIDRARGPLVLRLPTAKKHRP
jgi:hypothetical protein